MHISACRNRAGVILPQRLPQMGVRSTVEMSAVAGGQTVLLKSSASIWVLPSSGVREQWGLLQTWLGYAGVSAQHLRLHATQTAELGCLSRDEEGIFHNL